MPSPKQEIIVTIGPSGETTVEVHGVPGAACEKATQDIEHALGTVTARKRTAEYYRTAPAQRITNKT